MPKSETVVLGGGCFWCLEAVFVQMQGVLSVESGYMGGKTKDPTYHDVCSGVTGHVEVVRVTFDWDITSYRDILEVFFTIHDPTTRDRQGNDVGTQYSSVIFYNSDEQRSIAEQVIRDLDTAKIWDDPIVTELRPASTFYRAEDYHQNFLARNPGYPYIVFNDLPKIANLKRLFPALYRPDPVLVGAARS